MDDRLTVEMLRNDPERLTQLLAAYARSIDEQDRMIYQEARHIRDMTDILIRNGLTGPERPYTDG